MATQVPSARQTCSLGIHWYNCTCVPGYEGFECERDADECTSNPCLHNAVCIDSLNFGSCNTYIELASVVYVELAAKDEAQHSVLHDADIISSLDYGCLHDFSFVGMSVASYAAGAAVHLMGRNEGG